MHEAMIKSGDVALKVLTDQRHDAEMKQDQAEVDRLGVEIRDLLQSRTVLALDSISRTGKPPNLGADPRVHMEETQNA